MLKFTNLNVLYYITSGALHKRIYGGKPFYINYTLKENENYLTLNLIKTIISKDNIDISIIDDYRYFCKKKKGFILIKESSSFPIESDEIILQVHLGQSKNPYISEIESSFLGMTNKMKELEDAKNLNKNYENDNIDLYFLYASPIIRIFKNKIEEEFKPINYRLEIRNLFHLFNRSNLKFNCSFECANEKKLKDAIIKQPKILHLSSHGILDENREYSLFLEEKGVLHPVHQSELKKILSSVSEQLKNINLVFVSTCFSETLGELFLEYGIKNVIYIQGKTFISDKAAVQFSHIFYDELIKGRTIEDAFNITKRRLQTCKEKDYFQIEKCCCWHWHKPEFCPLKKDKKNIHDKYHNYKCDCDFDEFNIHEENCKLIQLVKKDKAENLFYFEKNINNTVKICCICCKPTGDSNKEKMIPHGESFKFILKQKNPKKNNVVFQYKKQGKLKINKNCYIMNEKDEFKNFSIVGRRQQIKEIYDIIDSRNINNIHFIIIYGPYEGGKKNFAELVCIYLFERKVINGFWMIKINLSKNELCDKMKELTNNGKNSDGKYIVVITIDNNNNLDQQFDLVNQILNEKNILNPYFYYIILISTPLDKIDYLIQCHKSKYVIKYLANLDTNSALALLADICKSYGYSINLLNLKEDQRKELLEMTGYSRKKINELAELIGKYQSFEKLKELIQSKESNIKDNIQNEIRKLMEKDISKIYFLLSVMTHGFPSSMLNLYEPDFKKIIKKEDEENIIYKEPNNNWYIIIENRYKKEICETITEDKRKECVCKCLEIYAQLLFYYIKKTRNKVCFPDCNIHYHFNSYNNKSFWKTFDIEIYKQYFLVEDKSNEYDNILEKDFILDKHTENIFYFIDKNIDIIKDVIFNDNNVEQKEYLNQILLMLPSIKGIEKYSVCKNIIFKCLYLCDKLMDSININFMDSKQRLNLFLLSKKENPKKINVDEFSLLGNEAKVYAYFIDGIKEKNIKAFFTSIEINQKINNKEINSLIPYAYYEIGCLYFLAKNYKEAKNILIKGLDSAKNYKDYFIRDKINIKLAIIMEEQYHIKDKYESFLLKVVNNSDNLHLISEANNLLNFFNKKLEPDIVMLNSNPFIKKENYSVLHNSIWANQNNQYYILKKISNNLKRDIRIKSIVLDEFNLRKALQEKGKILILQSDDFNEEGNLVLETNNGEGEPLSYQNLKNLIPKKLEYEVVILCFINSEKLIDLFKGKSKYLITFNEINIEDIDFDMLYEYNKLSIEFIIHFIKNSTDSSILKSFEDSLKTFNSNINNDKNSEIELINTKGEYITLNSYGEVINSSIIIQKKDIFIEKGNEKEGKAIYFYPLLQIPKDFQNKKYSDDILHLIKLILSSKKRIINIHSKFDIQTGIAKLNVKTTICFEIMKFFYRHQTFGNRIFYVSNARKLGSSLKDITYSVLGEKKSKNILFESKINIEESEQSTFIIINNFEKIKKIKDKNFYDWIPPDKFQYLILSKNPIENAFTYEINIVKEEKPKKNEMNIYKKSSKKMKDNLRKISSKNKIENNKDSFEYLSPNSNINSISNNKKKEDKKKKEKEIPLKSKYHKESDFTIIDYTSSNESSKSDSNSSEDNDSDM